ncbi:MAG: magnesium transporter CorA family protein [Acidimicrobiales bacterium]
MHGVLTCEGATADATVEAVEGALAGGSFFWLDLDAADDDTLGDTLASAFHFHPLTVEAALRFGQRPKIEDYDDYWYLVAHGAGAAGRGTTEVHLFFSDRYVVSVHRGRCRALDAVRDRVGRHHATDVSAPQLALVYLMVDALTDSFFPVLSALDDRIDDLEDAVLVRPTDEQLGQIFEMKRTLLGIRRVVEPQRDMFSSSVTLPGGTDESARYFRSLYDHLIRIGDMVDGYRDLLNGVMDTHLSTVSNRLNVVMKQLTVIATVFLPLTFLTGFFGQNFVWLVARLGGLWSFLLLGLGLELLAVAVVGVLMKRRGWLGGPTT